MNTNSARVRVVGLFGVMVVVAAGCGSAQTDETPGPSETTTSTSQTSTTSPTATSKTSSETTTSASPTPPTPAQTTPAAAIVGEGAACGPRGAVAVFADGATAYCAQLKYTDASVWSRDPSIAPNPAAEEAFRQAGPQIGDRCIGANIGRRAVDATGTAIVCDNYMWRPDVGQEPSHPWVDGQRAWAEEQRAWAECLESFTEDECREKLND